MQGGRLKGIIVSFLCTIVLLTGALFGAFFARADLSFAASQDGAKKPVSGDGDRCIIRIATWYNDYNLTYLKAFLAKAFPDYDIEFEYVDKSNYEPIIDSKLSYKGAPDILYVDREMVSKHALTGYFCDITDLTEGFDEMARRSFMYGNCVYAVPCTSQFECIYYNRDLFSAKKLAEPHSFDSFIECGKKLQDEGIKPVTASLKHPYDAANMVLAVVAANYLHTDRGKGFGGRLQYGRTTFWDELGPYMGDFEKLLQSGVITKDMCVIDSRTAVEEFTSGDAAMIVGGPETYNAIIGENPGMNIGTMPFYGENGKAIIGGCDVGFALNSNSRHMDEAIEVLSALTTVQGQNALWHDRPGSQTYLSGTSFTNEKVFSGISNMIDDELAFTPWMDWGQELNKAAYYQLGREIQRVMLGRESTEEALKSVDKTVYEILHRN